MAPRKVRRLGLSAKKRECFSKFKILFVAYMGAMKTKICTHCRSTKCVHVLALLNAYAFCQAKTRTHFVELKHAHVLVKFKFTLGSRERRGVGV